MADQVQGTDSGCNQQRRCGTGRGRPSRHRTSPAVIRFIKYAALVMLLCSVHCTAGRFTTRDARNKHKKISACSYYGHSCWGGHGKRNGNPPSTDMVAASSLLDEAQNYLLLAHLFRGATTPEGTAGNPNSSPVLSRVKEGEEVLPWKNGVGAEKMAGGGAGNGDVETGGGGAEVELGNEDADETSFDLLENSLSENGNTGYRYFAGHQLNPLELMHLRYLLMRYGSRHNN